MLLNLVIEEYETLKSYDKKYPTGSRNLGIDKELKHWENILRELKDILKIEEE